MFVGVPPARRLIYCLIIICLFLGAFSLNLSRSVRAERSHDEDQFVASAKLWADRSLLPYKDYPFFHMPNLVFIYGTIFRFTDHILLAARIFTALCTTTSAGLIFGMASLFFKEHPVSWRILAASGSVLFLLPNPLFAYTTQYSWNHELSVLFTLAAINLFLLPGKAGRYELKHLITSGFLLGLSIGTRLSFVTALLPFLAALFFHPMAGTAKAKVKAISIFSLGIFFSLLPSLWLFIMAPQRFIFGNIIYSRLNTLYRSILSFNGPMTMGEKIGFLWDKVINEPGNLLLLSMLLFFVYIGSIFGLLPVKKLQFERVFILILVPGVLVGSLLPSPAWYQYFYAPIPFAILATVYGIAQFSRQHQDRTRWALLLWSLMVLLANLFAWQDYRRTTFFVHFKDWKPLQIHQIGKDIQTLVGSGKVLTLGPIFPLEGGLEIYPMLVTGPFVWRTAPLIKPEKRQVYGVESPDELSTWLSQDPPRAILVGLEPDLEKAFIDYAQFNGFQPIKLNPTMTLWVAKAP